MKLLKEFARWAEGQGMNTTVRSVMFDAPSTNDAWKGYKARADKDELPAKHLDRFQIKPPSKDDIFLDELHESTADTHAMLAMNKVLFDPRSPFAQHTERMFHSAVAGRPSPYHPIERLLRINDIGHLFNRVTGWTANVLLKPPEPGVYIVSIFSPVGTTLFSRWDGTHWFGACARISNAQREPFVCAYPIDAWCGLNFDPKK